MTSTSDKKIRVLVVDESFFMRKLLREILQSYQDIQVVGEAKNGSEAIGQCILLKPDVITMDYQMPEMNGADATKQILSLDHFKKPAILMISAFTSEGMEETIECLRAGAFDYIQKPSGELSLDIEKLKEEIILKIRIASRAKIQKFDLLKKEPIIKKVISQTPSHKVVVIGASTGGPPVVEDILTHLPIRLNASILVIQHMPRLFTASFAKRLDTLCYHPVREAQEGDVLNENTILIAPGDTDLKVIAKDDQYVISLMDASKIKGIHPSIDIAMESAAESFHASAIGIILSGMGEDGAIGAQKIRSEGGVVIVQDPKTAVVDSMPTATIRKDAAKYITKPEDIPNTIIQLCA